MTRRAAVSRPARTSRRVRLLAAPAVAAAMLAAAGPALAAPTCSDFGWETHGDHVVNDYVAGVDGEWPPNEGELGAQVAGQGGANTPGGPAHFSGGSPAPDFGPDAGPSPGASFCVDASQAPSI